MIPVNTPLLDGNERQYLLECIETGWISSEGPFVRRFEESFAASVGRKFGVACSSGSGALDMAVAAANLQSGDEVIMPALTIISPAASVVRAGAVPVLIDSDPVTWNMDVSRVEEKISARTRAILVVHIYGLPVDLGPLLNIAERHNLIVIEDAAEMHGQTYRGQPCGSFGLMSTFSFYANKHVSSGEGGMVVTDDEAVAEHCRRLRNLCFEPARRFVHDELGWNYRMTNLQAAVGLAQLEQLSQHIERKRKIGDRYSRQLAGLKGIRLPCESTDFAENLYWVFGLVCEDDARHPAETFMKRLAEQNIGTRPFFRPMHQQPVFRRMKLFQGDDYPHAEDLARRGFYIPSGLGITDEQIDTVAAALRLLAD